MKTVHTQFARLTRNEPRFGLELRQFLAQAYNIKSIADYGLGPDTDVTCLRVRDVVSISRHAIR